MRVRDGDGCFNVWQTVTTAAITRLVRSVPLHCGRTYRRRLQSSRKFMMFLIIINYQFQISANDVVSCKHWHIDTITVTGWITRFPSCSILYRVQWAHVGIHCDCGTESWKFRLVIFVFMYKPIHSRSNVGCTGVKSILLVNSSRDAVWPPATWSRPAYNALN